MSNILDPKSLLAGGPRGLTHAIERTLWHLGFEDVRLIDGRNDGGADLLAVRDGEQWVVQAKWSGSGAVGRCGIDDCERAKAAYGADRSVLATNVTLSRTAAQRRALLARVGIRIDVWDGPTLAAIFERMPANVPSRPRSRDYQEAAIRALERDLSARGTALLVLATGLGKTVVGGEVIRRYLDRHPGDGVLVVAHMRELVEQLERAIWRHLPKETPTQVLTGESHPPTYEGVTFATIDSALGLIATDYAPKLLMVDETHHVSASGMYQRLLDEHPKALQFGVTATPWRGDKFDIATRFGEPSFSMGHR